MTEKYAHSVTKALCPEIALHAVTSSQIKSIGFDPETNTLAVQFSRGSGAIYHYPNVAKADFDAFIKSESIGTHFGKHIKPLPFEKFELVKDPVEA